MCEQWEVPGDRAGSGLRETSAFFFQEKPGDGLETPNAGPTPGGLTQNLTGFRLLPSFLFKRRFDLVIPLSLPSAGITVVSYCA